MKKILVFLIILVTNIFSHAQAALSITDATPLEAQKNISTPENVYLLVLVLFLFAFVFLIFHSLGKAATALADAVGDKVSNKNNI